MISAPMAISPHIAADLMAWNVFDSLPYESQVAIKLRWGNDISGWYWNECHLPQREALRNAFGDYDVDEELLELLADLLLEKESRERKDRR